MKLRKPILHGEDKINRLFVRRESITIHEDKTVTLDVNRINRSEMRPSEFTTEKWDYKSYRKFMKTAQKMDDDSYKYILAFIRLDFNMLGEWMAAHEYRSSRWVPPMNA